MFGIASPTIGLVLHVFILSVSELQRSDFRLHIIFRSFCLSERVDLSVGLYGDGLRFIDPREVTRLYHEV